MTDPRAPRPSRPLQYQLAGRDESAGSGPLVLIVDDDPDMARLIRALLTEAGYRGVSAFDAMQGMMVAQREVPSLIIVDLHMPAGGGLKLLEKLKSVPKTAAIPLLVLTGDTTAGLPEKARALGAEEFLLKPLDHDLLRLAVQRLAPR